jgi:two-component sensor histidine kinase
MRWGVGMPKDIASAKPGLGTSIIQALAGRLKVTITSSDTQLGTMVSEAHVLSPEQPGRSEVL